jgi:hypothetical protein
MSAFSAAWLAAREPWDHRARSPRIAGALVNWLERRGHDAEAPARIVDLGCGTGSTPRYLNNHLAPPPAWTLVDGDHQLLEIAARSTGAVTIAADLAEADLGCLVAGADLVTASALLDLVSERWLDQLWRAVQDRRAGFLAGLTYDGRMTLDPPVPFDAVVRDLTNRHQGGDKGFGPALGPRATAALVTLARHGGWRVMVRRADWTLARASDGPGLDMLIDGWAGAATEVAPGLGERIDDWRAERRARPDLKVTVGHRDLLVLPPD